MNGVIDNRCRLSGHTVIVSDCEACLGSRKCDPVCLYRGFVWGAPDEWRPQWVHRYETARKRVLALTPYKS